MRVNCQPGFQGAVFRTVCLLILYITLPVSVLAGEKCPTPTRGKTSLHTQSVSSPADTVDGVKLISQRLSQYGKAFPEVSFMWLRGVEDLQWVKKMPAILGEGADDEVYEHGPAARKILLEAEYNRISNLIQLSSPSSTLFHTGKHSKFKTSHVCVITLDDRQFLADKLAASRFFLGTEKVPADLVVSPVTTLRFTLDHEVFHCLDAYLNGPMYPKTQSRAHAQYSQLLAEMRADFYAAVILRRKSDQSGFVPTLAKVRTLGLFYWDLAHFTRPALTAAMREPTDMLRDEDYRDLAQLAYRTVHKLQPDYRHFRHWRAAVYWAAVSNGAQAALNDPYTHTLNLNEINVKTLAQVDTELTQITRTINAGDLYGKDMVHVDNTMIAVKNTRPGRHASAQ